MVGSHSMSFYFAIVGSCSCFVVTAGDVGNNSLIPGWLCVRKDASAGEAIVCMEMEISLMLLGSEGLLYWSYIVL